VNPLFDLIELNGRRSAPLQVRKAMLSSVLAKAAPGIRLNDHTPVVNFRLELEWQQAIMAPIPDAIEAALR
jgi:ATP-dependent DNA ligase